MLKPANDAHSIKAVAFVCEFDQEISHDGLNLVALAFKRFRSRLPLKRTVKNIALQLQGESKMQPAESISGYRFYSKAHDNTEKVWFEVSANRAVFWTSEYVTFSSFHSDVVYFAELACEAFAASNAKMNKAILEYRDEFISEEKNWDPKEVLRANNQYVANAATIRGELWHNHCGFFSYPDEGQVLNNLRIEHTIARPDSEVGLQYVFALTLLHVLTIEPSYMFSKDTVKEDIGKFITVLRAEHKNIFSKILTDSKLEEIGFN